MFKRAMKAGGDAALAALERRIGHSFTDRELLLTALTHASAVVDRVAPRRTTSGSSSSATACSAWSIAEMLLEAFPKAPEGELSQRLTELVRKETCAEVAVALDLGDALRFGGGEAQRAALQTLNVLGDVCEAVIGAIYLDGGLEAAPALHRGATGASRMLSVRRAAPRTPRRRCRNGRRARASATPAYAIVDQERPRPRAALRGRGDGRDAGAGARRGPHPPRGRAGRGDGACCVREGVWNDGAMNGEPARRRPAPASSR